MKAAPDEREIPPKQGNSVHSRRRRSTVLIGALLAILGFALAVQLRSNAATDSLSTAREDDLVRILDDQNSRLERLQAQIADLQAAKVKLSDSGSNTAAARAEAQKQADALAILTGTVPAHGPGIRVTISDPQHALRSEDLLDVVEELRGAGAEVIQFGPVRIGTNSAFTQAGSDVVLDGTTVTSPYTVLAIGAAKTMDTALNIPTGVVSTVEAAGGSATITRLNQVSITAVRSNPVPKFATPTSK
ncbi:DUF881 domain-containing protein [Jatrophihabitans telluris]|uniref:DUF881 domain-containing protein n=1 Tax=Jatrophihabitans telluris TaxID=2038343 RepID=A0ABY4R4B0_9ACTN|nr:DUF881 domain-containing protein [Jatrophihabitans telluris]UQX90133.1 DUF881 domain-containing protein [Jatrophihabitans telluris]